MISRTYHLATEIERESALGMWNNRRNEPLARRISMVAIGELFHSTSFERFVSQFMGYRYMDSGSQSIVLEALDNSHVMKVLLSSSSKNRQYVKQLSDIYQKLSDSGQKHLGDQWLSTSFYPMEMQTFPFMLRGNAVVAVQEKLEPIQVSHPLERIAIDSDTHLDSEIVTMINGVRNMYDDLGAYPDIRGKGNIAVVAKNEDAKLKIIDTTLVPGNGNMHRHVPGTLLTVAQSIEQTMQFLEEAIAAKRLDSAGFVV